MVGSITPEELKARIDSGDDIVVIDVREPWELEISSLDFTQHIVMGEIPSRLNELPKDKAVVFICRSGARSMRTAQFLAKQGWDENNLFNLDGGILAWAQEVDPNLPENY